MADNRRIDELISTLLAHPRRHQQRAWIDGRKITRERFLSEECGSTACACGWAIMLFGSDEDVEILTLPYGGIQYGQQQADLRQARISAAGRVALGLTREQAEWIFLHSTWLKDPNEAAIWALKHVKDHPGATALNLSFAARAAGLYAVRGEM